MDVDIGRDVDGGDSVSGSSDGEVVEEVVRVPRGRVPDYTVTKEDPEFD